MTEHGSDPSRSRRQPPGWKTPWDPAWVEKPSTWIDEERPTCFHCRYDLTGFAVGQTCPECGNEIRSLFESAAISGNATASVVCGLAGLACILGVCCGMSPLVLFWPLLSVLGMVLAFLARSLIRRHPHLYARQSLSRVRLGFWLCVPGVAVAAVLGAIVVSANLF